MKKIINGKVYDTDKAKELGIYCSPGNWNDFNYYEETLYQKRTGEFFLFGKGNANTKYAEVIGQNCWSGGRKILPMSYEDAREWAEKHLDADEYEEIFGVVDESGAKMTVTLSIDSGKWESAKREAAKRGCGISEYIESLI